MKKEYISAVLVNSQVLLSELDIGEKENGLDDNGFYTFINPVKPIIMPETNKIALVAMNPFSDSIEYKIHASHIMSMGSMDITYIDTYNNAVDSIQEKLKIKYQEYTEIPEYDETLNNFDKSNTVH